MGLGPGLVPLVLLRGLRGEASGQELLPPEEALDELLVELALGDELISS